MDPNAIVSGTDISFILEAVIFFTLNLEVRIGKNFNLAVTVILYPGSLTLTTIVPTQVDKNAR